MFIKKFIELQYGSSERLVEISTFCVETAIKIINEGGYTKPYAFRFVSKGRRDDELDSRVLYKSGLYYLGGVVETIEDVERRNDPSESILLSNMRNNGYKKVIRLQSGTRFPFYEDDVVLKWY